MTQTVNGGLATTQKQVVGSTPTASLGYGPGGLFNFPGLERTLVNAMVLPDMGLVSRLPSTTSRYTNPLFGLITGVTATTGSEPTGVCDDFPYAGLTKLCTHSAVWGRFGRKSRVYDVDTVGQLTDRGIFDDYEILGGPNMDNPNIPGNLGGGLGPALRGEIEKMRFELAVAWARDFARIVYSGNPTNNTSGGGYKEPYGLDTLVNDGYRDAETGVACPAADSLVRSFGNTNIATSGAGNLIVRELTYMDRYVRHVARASGLDPVTWAIVMREELFYELTAVWPCSYMTYLCAGNFSTSDVRMTDSGDLVAIRDAMRGGRYLLIDGRQVEVIFDEALPETAVGSGVFQSDIYFIPLRVLNNRPVTYLEYKNYEGANGPLEFANAMSPNGSYFTTNGGRFLWHRPAPTNFCVEIMAKTEWRLVLRTPHIAARLTNVRYTPLIAMRDAFTDEPYFANGGRTSRSGYAPSYYSPTA